MHKTNLKADFQYSRRNEQFGRRIETILDTFKLNPHNSSSKWLRIVTYAFLKKKPTFESDYLK